VLTDNVAPAQALTLRQYQHDLIARIDAGMSTGLRRILVELPTGAGKTVVFTEKLRSASADGQQGLVLAHRRELVQQPSRKLHDLGLEHGIIAANFPGRPEEPIQVASIQTLHARAVRSRKMELPPADIVIVDEAHHATAQSWRSIIKAYPEATILGFTATPCRSDGRGLGGIFDVLVSGPSTPS
jgi:DNA repair protein RadD